MIVAKLKGDIRELELKVAAIQAECNHPPSARKSTPKSDGGNCDGLTSYWVVHECLLCDKSWHEDKGASR